MQKKNRNALLTLAGSAVLLTAFMGAASAQAIYVRDDDDDVLNHGVDFLALATTGRSIKSYWGGDNTFPSTVYNTNSILNWSKNSTQTYNTNHLMQQVMFEIGGCWSGDGECTKNGIDFGNVTGDEGTGTSTPFLNTNTLVQNAFLGSSGSGKNISVFAKGPAPKDLGELLSNLKDNKFGALLVVPEMSSKVKDKPKIMADITENAKEAVKSAVARSVPIPFDDNVQKAWKDRCKLGFNPTDDKSTPNDKGDPIKNDPEGNINAHREDPCSPASSAAGHVRQDRSLESLLGPLQYKVDGSMTPPPEDGKSVYVRFSSPPKSADHYPAYAAAGFCQNISQNAYPKIYSGVNVVEQQEVVNSAMLHETHDSRLVANCWHFFEERLQYSKGDRFTEQTERCKDDYEIRHIITSEVNTDCQANGRSTLQARADLAYRLDSPEYIKYLNSLGVAVRELLMAQALDAPEKFEHSLLMERQIMTSAMAAARSKAIPLPESGNKSYTIMPVPP